MRPLPATAVVLCLAACSGTAPGGEASATAAAMPSTSASAATPPTPPAPAGGAARTVKEDNDLYSFEYSYPAAAAALPKLKAWLDADLEKTRGELVSEAKDARAEAKKDGFPYHPYEAGSAWQVVTDLPGWLSLSTTVSSYSGGAHPNYTFDTLVWDKTAGRRLAPLDLFTSPAALDAAIRKPFCALLDKERGKRRGEPVKPGSTDMFDECIDPVKEIVILGSSNHQTFDRVGVLVPPYEAGPYAEGSYDVTLPVTDAVLRAVKPEYRAAFSIKP